VRTLLWPLFARSAWAQPATVLAGTRIEDATLASFARSTWLNHVSVILFDRSAWDQPVTVWRARQVREHFWPLFSWSAWVQPASEVAGLTGVCAALASVRSVGINTTTHCVVGQVWLGRFYGLCSLGLRALRQPLWWRARQVRTLLWPLFSRSAWEQPATVVAGTSGESAAVASFSIGRRGLSRSL
jgi:hypothetical protein